MLDFSIRYLQLLKTKFAGLNLTKILDDEEFYNKQVLDSINPYLQSPVFKDQVEKYKRVVDIGFGGGFPILPLARLLPHVQFLGVESRRKKVDAVAEIAAELGLTNVKFLHARLEEVNFDVKCVVTFKAVGTVANFLPLINSSQALSVFFYKGPGYDSDERESAKIIPGWRETSYEDIEVPLVDRRILVGLQGRNVPRGTVKSLVNLSDFL